MQIPHFKITKKEPLEILRQAELYSLADIREAKKNRVVNLTELCLCEKQNNHE